jgi:hypothetical protein
VTSLSDRVDELEGFVEDSDVDCCCCKVTLTTSSYDGGGSSGAMRRSAAFVARNCRM